MDECGYFSADPQDFISMGVACGFWRANVGNFHNSKTFFILYCRLREATFKPSFSKDDLFMKELDFRNKFIAGSYCLYTLKTFWPIWKPHATRYNTQNIILSLWKDQRDFKAEENHFSRKHIDHHGHVNILGHREVSHGSINAIYVFWRPILKREIRSFSCVWNASSRLVPNVSCIASLLTTKM